MLDLRNKYLSKSSKIYLFVFLIVLFLVRLQLIQKGVFSDTDEFPLVLLFENFDKLIHLNLDSFFEFSLHASHPIFEIIIRLIQAFFVKIYANIFDLSLLSESSLKVFSFFNILSTLLAHFFFYKILRNFKFSNISATVGVVVLTCLLNTNFYVRHLLSYDNSLLFFLIALFYLSKDVWTRKNMLLAGLFSGIGFFTYYGYFMLPMVYSAFVFIRAKGKFADRFKNVIFFSIPIVVMSIGIEGLSQFAEDSFFEYNVLFAQSITQGSPEEAFTYIFKYFNDVEKIWGLLFLSVFFFSLGQQVVLAIIKKTLSPILLLLILFVTVFLLYASYAYFSAGMVFYGRLLHMYYPFLTIGVLLFLDNKKWLKAVFVFASLINLGFVVYALNEIDYPRSILYTRGYFEDNYASIYYLNESSCGVPYDKSSERFIGAPPTEAYKNETLRLQNFCFFEHHPDGFQASYQAYKGSNTESLIWEGNHFMSFPAYTFEYCSIAGREYFMGKNFKLKVYKEN